MNVEELKNILEDNYKKTNVTVRLSMGTVHRINGCDIEPTTRTGDFYNIIGCEFDEEEKVLVLKIE